MRRLARIFIVGIITSISVLGVSNVLIPPSVGAAACSESGHILTLPYWYNGLQKTVPAHDGLPTTCVIDISADNNFADVWHVVLNVINILLQLVGLVAVGFVIYGGGRYIISQGSATQLTAAKQTITRALIGLVIAISAALIVTFITQTVFKQSINSDTYQVSLRTTARRIS